MIDDDGQGDLDDYDQSMIICLGLLESARPGSSASSGPAGGWVNQFIAAGGLKHLFGVFRSGALGRRGEPCWSEWKLDCLGFLLRLLVQFGVDQADVDTLADQLAESTTTSTRGV